MLDQNHLCFMFVLGLAEDMSRGRGDAAEKTSAKM